MARLLFVVATVAFSMGCGASTATQERRPDTFTQADSSTGTRVVAVPEIPADKSIRRDLTVAIAHDVDLKNREISFIVANGDVSVTGTVRSEDERTRVNDLAMNIGGVKSVANALRIAE
jgi:osmotically-inducible protein OsmY